jgi:hypothetical protein
MLIALYEPFPKEIKEKVSLLINLMEMIYLNLLIKHNNYNCVN